MPTVEFQIVGSTVDPDLVSLRPLNRAASGVRRELTAAGFKVGDRVVVVHKEEYEKLLEGWCSGECKTIRGDSDSGGLGCSVRRPEERKSPR